MDLTIHPGKLQGEISVIPSKSMAHRYLIAAAFADSPTRIFCPETSRDMDATADCLRALGAQIQKDGSGYLVTPVTESPRSADLFCRDSGSTLRFLLPIAGALGVSATFHLEGRLPQRPLSPLWEEMERMGCRLSRPEENLLLCEGKLSSGLYQIDGSVSSQFITGLLFALSLLPGPSRIQILNRLESRPYVDLTRNAMKAFNIQCEAFSLDGGRKFHSPKTISVEGDWSNGAFFLAAKALGSPLEICGLSPDSCQGDRICRQLFEDLTDFRVISAADIPDLIPILAVYAAFHRGARFTDIRRLRMKESDRVASVIRLIRDLGGQARETEETLLVEGTGLTGGIVDAGNDHRIAMAAAIAATGCKKEVTILGADCVSKSYPGFFEEYRRLGGNYEQYIW